MTFYWQKWSAHSLHTRTQLPSDYLLSNRSFKRKFADVPSYILAWQFKTLLTNCQLTALDHTCSGYANW